MPRHRSESARCKYIDKRRQMCSFIKISANTSEANKNYNYYSIATDFLNYNCDCLNLHGSREGLGSAPLASQTGTVLTF